VLPRHVSDSGEISKGSTREPLAVVLLSGHEEKYSGGEHKRPAEFSPDGGGEPFSTTPASILVPDFAVEPPRDTRSSRRAVEPPRDTRPIRGAVTPCDKSSVAHTQVIDIATFPLSHNM
jgi:hypothetical protein